MSSYEVKSVVETAPKGKLAFMVSFNGSPEEYYELGVPAGEDTAAFADAVLSKVASDAEASKENSAPSVKVVDGKIVV